MVLLFLLLIAAITLIVIGAAVDGMLYLASVGTLLLVVGVLYLAVRSVLHRRRPAHRGPLPTAGPPGPSATRGRADGHAHRSRTLVRSRPPSPPAPRPLSYEAPGRSARGLALVRTPPTVTGPRDGRRSGGSTGPGFLSRSGS